MHETYDHIDLLVRNAHLRTMSSVSLTGELRPPRHGRHVIAVTGVEILVPTTFTHSISPTARGLGRVSDGAGHVLDDLIDQIDPSHWSDANTYSGAATAVLGELVGCPVAQVVVSPSRADLIGNQVDFAGGAYGYQEAAVYLLAQPLAQARRLAELGYSELTQATVDELTGKRNRDRIREFLTDGWSVWVAQAQRDAERLLDEPAVWEAIGKVAEALSLQARVGGEQVREIIGASGQLTNHRIWVPDLAELDRVREQTRAQLQDKTPAGEGEPGGRSD